MLTILECKNASGREKPYKLTDGGGMYLLVKPNNARYWRLDYRFEGKRKTAALGVYPDLTLADARLKREETKRLLRSGIDPLAKKKKDILEQTTFCEVAAKFMDKKIADGRTKATVTKNKWLLSLVMPAIGNLPIALDAQTILRALEPIEKRGKLETLRRTNQLIGEILRYAIACGLAQHDPTPALCSVLTSPSGDHRAAITDPIRYGQLLRAIWNYWGDPVVVAASKISSLVMLRPGEIRGGEWREIDWDKAVWSIPVTRLKMEDRLKKKYPAPHLVPLSTQAIGILRDLHNLTGHTDFIFSHPRTKERHLSENSVTSALRNMGFDKDEMSWHGFRSSISTMLNNAVNEVGTRMWDGDAIERQLAHKDKNTIRGIYDRSSHWDERIRMMQWWSDECDRMRLDGGG